MRWILIISFFTFDASWGAWAKLTCEHSYNACINRCMRAAQETKPACIQSCNVKNNACEAPAARKTKR